MRQRFPLVLAAGARWPGADLGHNLPRFNWVKIDNKGANPVDVSLNANPTAGDQIDNLLRVPGGVCRVFNVAGPVAPHSRGDVEPPDYLGVDPSDAWASELFLVSAAGTTVLVEIADHPIVDLVDLFPTIAPLAVRIQDQGGATQAGVGSPTDGAPDLQSLMTQTEVLIYKGGSWDKWRTPAVFKSAPATATGDTALWTPAAGKKFRLMRFKVSVTSNATLAAGAVLTILLRDATTDIGVAHSVFVPTAAGPVGPSLYDSDWIDLGNGYLSALANNVLNINLSAALTAGVARVIAAGTEE